MEFQDIYENITTENVMYIVENIPTNETEIEFNDFFSVGCKCIDECNYENNCSCALKYGINYLKTNTSNIEDCQNIQDNLVLNSEKVKSGIYECNLNCSCKQKLCGNKLVQFGPRKHLQIRNCQEKGRGLFTTKKIAKCSFICEYAGEVITEAEAIKRYKYNKENQIMNYIICVTEHFGENIKTTYIDPCYFGNIGRFLNHSCNPNCQLILVRVNNTVPKVCVFSRNEIEENCELTFDYGDGNNVNVNASDLKRCLCGEDNCRTWMPYSVIVGT